MTAAIDLYAPISAAEALDRLAACAPRYLGTAGWWSRLAVAIDDLREQLAHADLAGLAAQVVADAPELAASALRLPELDDRVQAQAAQLRLEVAEKAGLRSEAMGIRASVQALLHQVRRLGRISEDLLHDTYQRDLGGD
jgi:hypothetical protein